MGVYTTDNGTRLSNLPVSIARPGPNTASETQGGQFDNEENGAGVISGYHQDSDSGDEDR